MTPLWRSAQLITSRLRRRPWLLAGGGVGLLIAVAGTLDYRALSGSWPWSAAAGGRQISGVFAAMDARNEAVRVGSPVRVRRARLALRRDNGAAVYELTTAADSRLYGLAGPAAWVSCVAQALRDLSAADGGGADTTILRTTLYVIRRDGSFAGPLPGGTGSPASATTRAITARG